MSFDKQTHLKILKPKMQSDIIKTKEEKPMSQNTYSKSEIDLKLLHLESKIDSRFEQLNQKIEYSVQHILSETKNMLLEQQIKEKSERENERKITNRWLIGIAITIGIFVLKEFFLK